MKWDQHKARGSALKPLLHCPLALPCMSYTAHPKIMTKISACHFSGLLCERQVAGAVTVYTGEGLSSSIFIHTYESHFHAPQLEIK